MKTGEVHPHLSQLRKVGLVVIRSPPVGSFGKIVVGIDAPGFKQRRIRFIQVRQDGICIDDALLCSQGRDYRSDPGPGI